MVSIDDLWEIPCALSKQPIIGPIKFKMAEICHLENREIAICQRKILMKFDAQMQICNWVTAM